MGEKELVKRCQKGDKKAFEELVERFYPYVSGFLLKTTRNSILAEDLTQETFLKMIRKIPSGRSLIRHLAHFHCQELLHRPSAQGRNKTGRAFRSGTF